MVLLLDVNVKSQEADCNCGILYTSLVCGQKNTNKSGNEKMTSQNEEQIVNKVFRIEYNSIVGRHLVANRNIEAGEVIIDEGALVCGPVELTSEPASNLLFNNQNNFNSVCSVCFQCYLNEDNYTSSLVTCDSCHSTAFCTSRCAHDKLHTENECKILRKIQKTDLESLSLRDFYNLITTIRLLFLRSSCPVSWKQVLNLQSKVNEFNALGVFSIIDRILEKVSWNDFQFKEKEGLDLANDKISLRDAGRHCLGVMRVNAYSLIKNQMRFQGLYFFTALASHSCIMNTDRQFDVREGTTRMIVKAAVKIREGDAITTAYLSLMNNTIERRAEMMTNWLFSCNCQRCQDETELGTFLSTVTFSSEESEFVPFHESDNDPINVPNSSSSSTSFKLSEDQVVCNIKKCMPRNIENIDAIERWLRHFDVGKYLHKNHSVFSQVKLYLCHAYGREERGVQGLSNEQLFRKRQLCLEILQIFNVLYAGLYQCRGELLFELWTTLREMGQRGLVTNDDAYTEENVAKEAHQILKHAVKKSSHAQMNEILLEECSCIF